MLYLTPIGYRGNYPRPRAVFTVSGNAGLSVSLAVVQRIGTGHANLRKVMSVTQTLLGSGILIDSQDDSVRPLFSKLTQAVMEFA